MQSYWPAGMGLKEHALPRPHLSRAAVAVPNLWRAGMSEIPGVGEVCSTFLSREQGEGQTSPRRLQLLPNMLRLVTVAGRDVGKPGKREGTWGSGVPGGTGRWVPLEIAF